ncbi:MAG: N-acetylmuramoyl-L-alanine amidase [Pseudomonadota bacterium]|nr:N-acetylmuramoyl-L-alanine amidase [Pseudomonadota bacterium]
MEVVRIGRFPRAAGWVAAFMALAGGFLCSAAAAADLVDVRFGVTSTNETRVVFDLTGPVAYAISGDSAGEGRLIVEFQGLALKPGQSGKGKGHFAGYMLAAGGGEAEAVLSFARTAKLKDHFIIPAKTPGEKTRLVIDVATADKAAFEASLPKKYKDLTAVIKAATAPTPAATTLPPIPEAPAPRASLPVIVVDAGHGGADPGATGPDGTREKNVTLAAALQLAEILKKGGRYRVVLTRTGDTRLHVEERLKMAREISPDLFISIHADAHDDHSLRGGSVYTLSDEGTKRSTSEALSQGDYQVFDLNIKDEAPDLRPILLDLAQNHTKNRSGQFADLLIQNLSGVTPLLNNTHRTADLKVLLSPDVAAVLLELAFISNAKDEANLTSPAWREKTMTAVAKAIDGYFDARTPVQHASNAGEGTH